MSERELMELQKHLLSDVANLSEAAPKPAAEPERLRQTFRVIVNMELLARALGSVRRKAGQGDNALIEHAEDAASRIALQVNTLSDWQEPAQTLNWQVRYRQVWKRNFSLFVMVLAVFIAGCLIGWQLGTSRPDYALIIIGQTSMENILERHAWFEDIQSGPFFTGLMIAWNNIRVALQCFLAGSLVGLGGIILLVYNGLLFGCMFGFCYHNAFDQPLFEFVLGHGPLELSIIIAATFSGVLFGRAFYIRPFKDVGARLTVCAGEAFLVLAGCAPWLILAATIEAFVSPWPIFSPAVRIGIGVAAAAAFWIWTLLPAGASSVKR